MPGPWCDPKCRIQHNTDSHAITYAIVIFIFFSIIPIQPRYTRVVFSFSFCSFEFGTLVLRSEGACGLVARESARGFPFASLQSEC